jgi:hypothetical protein
MSALTVGSGGQTSIAAPLFRSRPYNGMQESLSWSILSRFWASVKDGFSFAQRLLDVLGAGRYLRARVPPVSSECNHVAQPSAVESSNAFAGRMKSPPTMSALTCRGLYRGYGIDYAERCRHLPAIYSSPIPRLARDLNSL